MGFETGRWIWFHIRDTIMRHPYGIWNCGYKQKSKQGVHYETSLWDLKPIMPPHPLGIDCIMRHPYGIWNQCKPAFWVEFGNYETSLWDLKPPVSEGSDYFTALWDIPMGFETWTWRHRRIIRFIMRHPYGIWNHGVHSRRCSRGELWDIPMGFETLCSWHRLRKVPYYETSLWDLKPVGEYGDPVTYHLLWDIPMGFETKWHRVAGVFWHNYETSLWDLKPLFLYL